MRFLLPIFIILSTVFSTTAESQNKEVKTMETAVIAGGCFWCTEAIFQDLKGVDSVVSGYTGGKNANPTYEEVSGGASGHAEAIEIKFDPSTLSFADLLIVFFHLHDPTTLNRQGADAGTQYRSGIFYKDEKQKEEALKVIAKITEEKLWKDKIVTEVTKLDVFYKAEDYHQNYYKNNSAKPYCSLVIGPKIAKLKKEFAHLMK